MEKTGKEKQEAWIDKHLANIKRIQKEAAMQHAKNKEAEYVAKMDKRKNRRY